MTHLQAKGVRKGFGFVTYEREDTMKEVLKKGHIDIGEHKVDLRKAAPKNQGGPGGGGAAGGYGGGFGGYGNGYADYYGYGGGYDAYGWGGGFGGYGAYGGGGGKMTRGKGRGGRGGPY